ncbi:unnamed protein product [Bursaphelenchus okinawaensis]|uniref:G_PROTEIN_RECEP_F1_2 domain-containing protein n=1 Tax=Bursaphelenchus okinawaensis TaxID=465554 RepID=A0A811LT96_9BILA|nr:unnamed protein product [Bursaphelenchus okinawaensis]CAG9128504.1 unnamed protein product [Bursaphelenchus okinawaensis]
MTIKQTLCLYGFTIAITFPVFFFARESYSNSGRSRPGYNYAKLWYDQVPVPNLLIGDEHYLYQQINCNYTGSIMLSSYFIFAILAVKTVRVLKLNGNNLAEKTKALQRQLTYYLLLQAFLPCVIVICPVIFVVVKLFLHENTESATILTSVFIAWIPVCNPLMTICVMTPYRNGILALFSKKKVAVYSTSYVTSNA